MIRLLLLAALVLGALWWIFGRNRRPSGTMTLAEARALLGVGPEADAATIRTAWRLRIAAAHPDHGGDARVAARLNMARDRALAACREKE